MSNAQLVPTTIEISDTAASLPIIDMSGLRSSNLAVRAKVGRQIGEACRDKGFFYVTGHEISSELQQRVIDQAAKLFALAPEEKAKVDKSLSQANRGYEPLRNQVLEAGAPADVKEGFYIGQDKPLDHPDVLNGKFNQGPNLWPETLPEFRATMEQYQWELEGVAQLLMQGVALSLGLPEQHFTGFCHDAMTTLRLLHYPPQSPSAAPGEKGCGAHTDWGGLTLLLQDDNSGLQVWDQESNGWIWAMPVPGSYVVNIGDLISRWTNDLYRSTLHRVVNLSGNERYSVPYFYSGNVDHKIECIQQCLIPGESPKYPVITVEDHYKNMFRKTYAM